MGEAPRVPARELFTGQRPCSAGSGSSTEESPCATAWRARSNARARLRGAEHARKPYEFLALLSEDKAGLSEQRAGCLFISGPRGAFFGVRAGAGGGR
jgi:hypothetical protein